MKFKLIIETANGILTEASAERLSRQMRNLSLAMALAIASNALMSCATNSENSKSNRSATPPPPTIVESGKSKSSSAVTSAAPSDEGDTSKSTGKGEEDRSVTVQDSQYAELTSAIRAQNDEQISKAAAKILLQSPNDVRGLNSLALVNYKRGRYSAAQYLLNKAIAQNTNNSEVHSNLGLVLLAQQERRDAIKAFKKALEINPEDAVAAANLGSIYVQERDYSKASIALEIAYKKGFRDSKSLNNYAVALMATGKKPEADGVFKTLMKDNSNNKEVLFNYIVFLVEYQQKYKEGLEQISRLKFIGLPGDSRNRIIALENKAKAGLK